MEITMRQREVIAKNVVKILSVLLNDSQQILKLSGVQTMTFDDFMSKKIALQKTIEDYDQSEEGLKEKAKNPYGVDLRRKVLTDALRLHRRNADNVSFTKENIDELMDIVSKSILKHGLGHSSFSADANFFLRHLLTRINADDKRVEKWMDFIYSSEHIVNSKIDNEFSVGYDDIIKIDSNCKTAFVMTEDGKIEVNDFAGDTIMQTELNKGL